MRPAQAAFSLFPQEEGWQDVVEVSDEDTPPGALPPASTAPAHYEQSYNKA